MNGFAVCLDPALMHFVNQLPYDAYTAGTNVNHTPEATQLPLDLSTVQAPPPTTPSVIADEAQDTTKPNLLSKITGFATKVCVGGGGGR